MRFKNGTKLDFDDVLILPKRSTLQSRADVDLRRTFKFLHTGDKWKGIPIITSNMTTVGTIATAQKLQKYRIITSLHKFHKVEDVAEASLKMGFHAYTISNNPDISYSDGLYEPWIVRFDVANGYRQEFVDTIESYRETVSDKKVIIAGNVCTPEMTEELLLAGADIVVVGIGSGGQCTTRMKTGIGCPQLSAIIECADAAHGLNGLIAADGGCRVPGDICKAFAAGADFVMLGSMLAGHNENTEEKDIETDEDGSAYTHTYGMSSRTALDKHFGGIKKYRTSEGKTTKVYLRGPISDTIDDILASIRSCCTYVGARSLKELSKRATFIKVNRQRNTYYDKEQVGD